MKCKFLAFTIVYKDMETWTQGNSCNLIFPSLQTALYQQLSEVWTGLFTSRKGLSLKPKYDKLNVNINSFTADYFSKNFQFMNAPFTTVKAYSFNVLKNFSNVGVLC